MTNCLHCGEPVEDGEQSEMYHSQPMHKECGLRGVIGSVAHIEHRCSCFAPGSTENDDPNLSIREAARAAVAAYKAAVRLYGEAHVNCACPPDPKI